MARKNTKPAPRKDIHRVGRRIRVREVRVISADGEQLGIMPTSDAMRLADDSELQLVEVNPTANPPVCKIMDYGKFKYENAKRDRDTKRVKKTQELKEVKFRPKTHLHDFDFKVKHARRFLEEGDKVRLLVQFRGREIVHPETGRDVLERVFKSVEDIAAIHQPSRMEGSRMNMILAPKPRRESGSGRSKQPAASGNGKPALSRSSRTDASDSGNDSQIGRPVAGVAKAPKSATGEKNDAAPSNSGGNSGDVERIARDSEINPEASVSSN